MSRVHLLGAGLSTTPGIRRLANTDQPLIVWNRTLDKAIDALAGTTGEKKGTAEAASLDWDMLDASIDAGDVLVSMLPGDFHVKVAKMCVESKAHFVSSSYLSPEMTALQSAAVEQGVSLVNEVGLDPGIDHLFAHALVDAYTSSKQYSDSNKLYFRSYCGGVPAVPNDFKYKFSWSPFGVLKALTSPAKWIEEGSEQTTETPWKAVTDYKFKMANGKTETFEAYPNRDSLPFIEAYHFKEVWPVEQFVRGTLRLSGWSSAWDYLFQEIEKMTGKNTQSKLTKLSDELWKQHAYDKGELDRVVLVVELEVRDEKGDVVWHQLHSIDDTGNDEGTSMARLVSHTVSLAVESTVAGEFPPGVHAAPSDSKTVQAWLKELSSLNGGFDHSEIT